MVTSHRLPPSCSARVPSNHHHKPSAGSTRLGRGAEGIPADTGELQLSPCQGNKVCAPQSTQTFPTQPASPSEMGAALGGVQLCADLGTNPRLQLPLPSSPALSIPNQHLPKHRALLIKQTPFLGRSLTVLEGLWG